MVRFFHGKVVAHFLQGIFRRTESLLRQLYLPGVPGCTKVRDDGTQSLDNHLPTRDVLAADEDRFRWLPHLAIVLR